MGLMYRGLRTGKLEGSMAMDELVGVVGVGVGVPPLGACVPDAGAEAVVDELVAVDGK